MRIEANGFEVTLKLYSGPERMVTRYATFDEVEEVISFLETMTEMLNIDDEVVVSANVMYEKLNGEIEFDAQIEMIHCLAQHLKQQLTRL